MFNHRDNFSCSYISSICLSPSLTHPYWRRYLFVSASYRQPTFGACQTKAAVSKHLITARGDAQDTHGRVWIACILLSILPETKRGVTGTKKNRSDWFLRCHISRVSVLVIPNLSHFTSEGDNRADALCRRAVITDGISVRVWMCVISGFRLSQTPLVVLKTIVTTSRAERCVRQRTWPEGNSLWILCAVLYSNSSNAVCLCWYVCIETIILLLHLMPP